MGKRERNCMKCGKLCSGKMCQKCYRSKKRGQLSRLPSLKK
jgi:NMD protein affecting ribosome stability and mRNA decay